MVAIAATLLAIAVTAVYFRGNTFGSEFNSDKVVQRLTEDYPNFDAKRVVFDSAGRGALVLPVEPGPVGLVWRMHNKTVSRLLSSDQLHSWSVSGPQLTLRLARFGLFSPTFLIDDPDDLIDIRKALEAG